MLGAQVTCIWAEIQQATILDNFFLSTDFPPAAEETKKTKHSHKTSIPVDDQNKAIISGLFLKVYDF